MPAWCRSKRSKRRTTSISTFLATSTARRKRTGRISKATWRGGIPAADIGALQSYWDVYPSLKQALVEECRPGYSALRIDKTDVRTTIFEHPEFVAFREDMRRHFGEWRERTAVYLKSIGAGSHPKDVIFEVSEDLLAHYSGKPLVDKYDIYQHLMDYWSEVMQDDCYLIAADAWVAETYRIIEKGKNGKDRDKGWACDLIPKEYVVARFFADEQAEIERLASELEAVEAQKTELEEEHGGEDDALRRTGQDQQGERERPPQGDQRRSRSDGRGAGAQELAEAQ